MTTLVQYEPFVDSTTELFLSQTDRLYARTGKGCDFSKWLQFYAFDVIGKMTYSKRHDFIEEDKDIDGIVDYLGKRRAGTLCLSRISLGSALTISRLAKSLFLTSYF
jgi:hypothetical protein